MPKFHTTNPYSCSYLPDRLACSEIATPEHLIDTRTYGKLVQAGFRRSGHYIYRPCCEHCQACQSVRVNVKTFTSKRAQRRAWKLHRHLIATQHPLHYKPEHYALYQRYQSKRHLGGGMDNDCREQYHNFLLQSYVNSKLVEFHEADRLRMISIIDILPDGISSVYTFFDADIAHASFGTYNILWQIEQCRQWGLDYLYLGYWIKENQKMRYKANFQPLEILINGCWQLPGSGNIS
ncbi:arginyltransferase [Nitrosomonas ureae]|uniref:Aspartate/glutamate leucyltransferase n=1 Tax=Nitrosomonas ureae TaxID=44577 RepID=A0A1H5SI45_9PROT|nr:arginyltransferase [Nitrosomonas ureae]SEF50279.1 arginine-tRNA-protein transferase [Nitrosomonas ureae]